MKRAVALSLLVFTLAGSLAGCGDDPGQRAVSGGLIGAGAGAVLGGSVGAAAVGGVVGAGVGAATTPDHDR